MSKQEFLKRGEIALLMDVLKICSEEESLKIRVLLEIKKKELILLKKLSSRNP